MYHYYIAYNHCTPATGSWGFGSLALKRATEIKCWDDVAEIKARIEKHENLTGVVIMSWRLF